MSAVFEASIRRAVSAVLVACSLAMIGCNGDSSAGAPRRGAVSVDVAGVIRRTIPIQIRAIGSVEVIASVSVKSRVTGQVAEVLVRDGQLVDAGDELFVIDRRPFQAALDQAQATLEKDRALAANAAAFASRQQEVYKQNLISSAEYDQAKYTAQAAAATARADEAAVETARLQLSYCTIRSPIRGRTGSVWIKTGNNVKADETMLVLINQIEPIYVAFGINEQDLPAAREVLKRTQRLPAWMRPADTIALVPPDSHAERGTLNFIDNQVDATTGMVRLKSTFANTDRGLWPGQYVNVTLTVGVRPDALLVPTKAIQAGQQGRFVFIVKDDQTVEMRPVTVGPEIDDQSVIESGVSAGQTVVTEGQLRLVSGAKVQVKRGTTLPT